jgi:hypothetical protein
VRIPLLVLVVLAALSGSFWHPAEASEMDESDAIQRATGSFEVTLKPLDAYNTSADAKVARMSIDKSFAGDLVATSRGEMLSGGSPAEGSAGYVAIERVTGTLDGRAGSFLLQHSGTMTPESQELTITVIPASGTGELEGLAGTMSIEIEEGHHLYSFEYTLTAKP